MFAMVFVLSPGMVLNVRFASRAAPADLALIYGFVTFFGILSCFRRSAA